MTKQEICVLESVAPTVRHVDTLRLKVEDGVGVSDEH